MTQEQKNKVLTSLTEVRNNYSKDCERRIAELQGKITGASYMAQRIYDIIRIEFDVQESEENEND